jgi:ribose transport system permease protein
MGGVILLGVIIDQQWSAFRAQRLVAEAARQSQ